MNKYLIFVCLILFLQCGSRSSTREKDSLENAYNSKKELLKNYAGDFFSGVEDKNLTDEEIHYLKFLFAYMPLSDFSDYDFNFFLDQVRYSIEAKNTFPWAKDIPDDIFMHYVLPPRMNNENMDTARIVFFAELKERLLPMDLSMDQAALEVNHWCHEKANYRPTDERTISPLGIIKSAFGRCGEESTFTTTALRAAGIPARQVYTPRWAHTDDNHAWVEVWISGKWYFMGACEPSPALNRGWFEVPATRAMLIHTKQFGKSENQNENYISETDNFTWVNALETYSPTKMLEIYVVDGNGNPVPGANVQFQLYNYAELYPIHREKTNESGIAKFKTGFGSLEVFVDNGKNFVNTTVDPNVEGQVKVVLSDENIYPAALVEYIPPVAGKPQNIDSVAENKNNIRLAQEDSIRAIYEATFYNAERSKEFAAKYNFSQEIEDYLVKSRGNWPEIENFLISAAERYRQKEAIRLLKVIAEKDLRDTRADILNEHMEYALKNYDENIPVDIFDKYVLNPRISFEMLKSYRKIILSDMNDTDMINEFKSDPEKITKYILADIKTKIYHDNKEILCNDLNSYRVPITPAGVHKLKLSDDRSLKIYYVAFCRSIGIPSRIEQASGLVQVYSDGQWMDIVLGERKDNTEIKRGTIKLLSAYDNRELKYRVHFALARLVDADFRTVDLGWEIPISEFSEGVELQTGHYMLLSSVRKEDGSVIVKRKYFDLHENEDLIVEVDLPDVSTDINIKEKFIDSDVYLPDGKLMNTKELKKERSYSVYCWLDPGKEPSKHIVRDLTPMISELGKNNVEVYFFVDEKNFDPVRHGFSKDLNYLYDKDLNLLTKNSKCSAGGSGQLFPQIKMTDNDGNIIFSTEGYTIGIGEMLLNKVL